MALPGVARRDKSNRAFGLKNFCRKMATPTLTCRQFTDFLIRRTEHLDEQIIKDIQPTDGWIGHVSTGLFPTFAGNEHTFDRVNRVFPDLSGCWQDMVHGSCIGTPCDPEEKKIGLGSTRDSYKLQRRSYGTDLFCFDQILSADRAKEEFSMLVQNLKEATNIIISDRLRTEALRIAATKVVSDQNVSTFTFTTNDDCTQIVPSTLPSSKLTISILQRQVYPLMLNGYLGANPNMPPMFELVTDIETAWNLRENNPNLASMVQFRDFVSGGAMFKFGITDSIGNFGIRNDLFPLRYQLLGDGQTLQRVFPYRNVPATNGIKSVVNQAYIDARYQIDFIWNRMAMRSLVRDTAEVNSLMPFAKRDFGGKWQFVMDNLGADSNGCVINNERRNKGKFIADFSFATKAERPEWAVAILSLREPTCVTVQTPCTDDPGYVTQDYSSANDICPTNIEFDLSGVETPYVVGDVTCNGVPVDHDASGNLANMDALVTWLNDNLGSLGTWSGTGTTLTLSDTTCSSVTIDIT